MPKITLIKQETDKSQGKFKYEIIYSHDQWNHHHCVHVIKDKTHFPRDAREQHIVFLQICTKARRRRQIRI